MFQTKRTILRQTFCEAEWNVQKHLLIEYKDYTNKHIDKLNPQGC